jgi:CheY-like chemotaxis protein
MPSILVIDDEAAIRETLKEILKETIMNSVNLWLKRQRQRQKTLKTFRRLFSFWWK